MVGTTPRTPRSARSGRAVKHAVDRLELRPNKHVTGQRRQTVTATFVAAYTGGMTIRQIVEKSGRSYGFVHRVLGEAGVLRGRGQRNPVSETTVARQRQTRSQAPR